MTTPRPHDALFKFIFGRRKHAGRLIRSCLPQTVTQRMDFRTLKLESGSFVNEALGDRHADLVYTVRLNGAEALVHLVLEHQSTPDPQIPVRILRYTVRIWDRWLVAHPSATTVPAVVGLLVTHGVPWEGPRSLGEMIALPAAAKAVLGPYIPDFKLFIADLAKETPLTLEERPLGPVGRLTWMALQRGREPGDVAPELARWAPDIDAAREDDEDALWAVVRYLMTVNETTFASLREHLAPVVAAKTEEVIMTRSHLHVTEIAARERSEGREEGMLELLLSQLERKFGAQPDDWRERLEGASPEQLKAWASDLLEADSLDAIFKTNGE